eukprot:m.81569 g.81569  ORF g.81569 m.81569 type:complete len:332 (+) comp9411_c0_seq1:345-1340(+)
MSASRGSEFECEWCQKPFKYPSQLKEHIRVHTREKPYPCTFCSKAFSHSSALTQHERIHTGEKPFKCSHCNKAFSQSSNLKRHERVHKNQRPSGSSSSMSTSESPLPIRRPSSSQSKENTWRPMQQTGKSQIPMRSMSSMQPAGKKQGYTNILNMEPRRTKTTPDPVAAARINALMPRHLEQLISPRSFKLYQMASPSPLRPINEKVSRDFAATKADLLSVPAEPRVERCSGGEDFFSVDAVSSGDQSTFRCDPIQPSDQAMGRSAAISDSIEQYFDLSGPSLSPLMTDEVFPMFILSPTMGLGGSPHGRMASPLTSRDQLENNENLHFRF